MSGLRILITNNTLDARAGSELYVRDIATALLERGHTPIAFTTLTGDVARELRQARLISRFGITNIVRWLGMRRRRRQERRKQ